MDRNELLRVLHEAVSTYDRTPESIARRLGVDVNDVEREANRLIDEGLAFKTITYWLTNGSAT